MATHSETAEVIRLLAKAYPRYTFDKDTVRVYAAGLRDIPAKALQAGASAIITESKWFPAVSELRTAALEFTDRTAMQDAADRLTAEKLRISWQCCPACQYGPMVRGHCPRCSIKIETEAAAMPQLEGAR